ncbi:hypothetical protein Bca101_008205 [Brassica carinata]
MMQFSSFSEVLSFPPLLSSLVEHLDFSTCCSAIAVTSREILWKLHWSAFSLNPLSFARLTKDPSNQFRKRRNLSCRIRRTQFGAICSKTSDYQDYQSYARPLRLLPAEEVKVNQSPCRKPHISPELHCLAILDVYTGNPSDSGDPGNRALLVALISESFENVSSRFGSIIPTIPATLSSNDESFKFQRGSVDEFTFLGPELGKIRAVWISLESGQWRVGGVSLWVVKRPVLGETNVEEAYCYYRYDFEVDDILLGESSDLSMVELRPSRITELTDSDQISSPSAPPNIGSTVVSNEESMEEYENLKLSLLLYDALLILLGSSLVSFSLGGNSAVAFFFGGTVGFLYLLLLQRSVDELQVPGSSSSSENSSQILSGRVKIPVLSLALAIGLLVLAVRGYSPTAFAPLKDGTKENVFAIIGLLTCILIMVFASISILSRQAREREREKV